MFLGLQQIKEKPGGWSGISKDPSYKNGPRDTGSMDPDVQLCHCIESTVIEIINTKAEAKAYFISGLC